MVGEGEGGDAGEGSSMWRGLPVITFQKFDDITGRTIGRLEVD